MNDDFDYSALTEQLDDEGLQTAYGVKPYDGRNFYVTLRLSDLYFVDVSSGFNTELDLSIACRGKHEHQE